MSRQTTDKDLFIVTPKGRACKKSSWQPPTKKPLMPKIKDSELPEDERKVIQSEVYAPVDKERRDPPKYVTMNCTVCHQPQTILMSQASKAFTCDYCIREY